MKFFLINNLSAFNDIYCNGIINKTKNIEIKVHIRHGEGFESVAKQICAYDEVQDLYLMSGGYDLMVALEGKTLRDVARFVGEKLAVIDGVTGTATHFVLTKYKDKGVMMDSSKEDHRMLSEI